MPNQTSESRARDRKGDRATFSCVAAPVSRTVLLPCLVFHADKWPDTPTMF